MSDAPQEYSGAASSRLRLLARANGVLCAGAVFITQLVAVYSVDSLYGPKASYEAFIGGMVFSFWALLLGTAVGANLVSRSSPQGMLAKKLAAVWLVQAGVVLALIAVTWWMAHGKPWAPQC